ncbi:quinone oxidoreductase family protein [Chondromyces apiculatus]|uniref:Oxidoreductase n=1 Tax=Chondromyces apiculatus DSM 436 TaxID=1192034 RepID=A0A017T5G7_9BACT|nr:zinc-binding dehydrogenase [Chondromyces apiculatus]EYF04508.1 oxidoreductase [Chondromyces apiculatus DSM 436]
MKAVTIRDFGGPENLVLQNVPALTPAAGQVLITIEAAGVGLADILMRTGAYRGAYTAPAEGGFVPGLEVAGTVAGLGTGVDPAWRGRRVFAPVQTGGYAEQAVFAADALIPLPDAISAVDAVALGVNALVAKIALERARLVPGERVLVRGAAGGIGTMATQLAAHAGAIVAATTSTADRGQRLRELGAVEILDRAATGAEAFDVILDNVLGPDLATFLGKLKENGRMVLCGAAGGFPPPDFGMALLAGFQRSLTLSTLSLNSVDAPRLAAALQEVFALVAAGHLKPVIEATLPLAEAAAAHARLESGQVFGKLVLVPV